MLHMLPSNDSAPIMAAHGKTDGLRMIANRRILVVEDEALIALDLEMAIEDAGAKLVGPAPTLAEALQLADGFEIDGAILDVNLRGQDVFPLAGLLLDRGVPFVFHTGHAERVDLEKRYPGMPVCRKPTTPEELLGTLGEMLT